MPDRPEYARVRDLTTKLHAAMTAHGTDSPEAEAVRDEIDDARTRPLHRLLTEDERAALRAYSESLYVEAEAEAARAGVRARD